jgi:Ca2+-binding RTX toxin-like protein
MNTNIASLYDFTLQQMAAESYSEGVDLTRTADVKAQLRLGTNREGYKGGPSDLNEGYPGYTRMTSQQADEFLSKFKIVHQWSDNPSTGKIPGSRPLPEGDPAFARLNIGELLANTGLSATLILKKNADGSGSMEYTLAIRSTEFRDWADGGDGQRDKTGADVKGIAYTGFALAQQYALEQYYQWLKDNGKLPPGAKLNVTGYSLGGNLATVFTEMHQAEMGGGQTVTMNGAGRGTWNASAGGLSEMINYFHSVLLNPALAPNPAGGMYTTERGAAIGKTGMAFDPKSMYQDERYTWAVSATKIKFGLSWNSLADENRTGTLADSIITQMYGFESINNTNLTANSGTHGPALKVGIESQPAREGIFGGFIGTGDFGNGHSITLIADSLALQRTMHKLDTNFELTHFINLLPSTSFRDTKNGLDANYEADPLENVLDALRRAILGAGVTKTEFKDGASGFGDITKRETYHANIKALTDSAAFKALEGNVILDPLYGKSATALFGLAKNGDIDATAYGYALKQLNPFAILGAPALYDKFNTHGELKLYDPATGQGELSEQWLEDRAALLRAVNMRNTQNVSTGTVLDPMARSGQVTDFSYFDPTVPYDPAKPATKIDITTRQMGAEFAQHQTVSFGGDGPDTLVGTNSNLGDHLYGGAGADTLKGYAGADLLEGGMDDDQLYGGHGKDTLMGGSGSDHLWGEGGGDKLVGGSGKDYIYGGADDDTIYGDVVDPDSGAVAFDDELYGDSGRDTLYGGGGNDTLVGGAGDDRLYGGGGNDTYVFDGGVDVIDDSSGTDTVRLDISLDQVTFSRDGNDLLVYVGGSRTDNFLRVVNGADGSVVEYFESPGYGRLSFAEMQAKFDSVGRTLGRSDMRDLYDEEALQEESPHYLMGSKGNDIFSAGDGWVLEPNSNPPYYMWDGVQYYWDKAGNDTYVLDTGFGGYISIWDESGEDTIRFGNGISPDNVKFSLSTGYLRLIVNGNDNDANNNYKPPDSVWRCPTDVVELPGWGLGGRIEWAVFADGTVWNLQEKVTACAAPYWIDTAGGDRIGWAMDLAKAIALGLSDREIMSLTNLAAWDDTSEVVSGLGGNDELYSGDGGSDIFIGGVGNDTIYGNGTNNVFVFNVGDGQDTLRMSAAFAFVQNRLHTDANLDILRFGVGIAPEDIVFERRGKDMIVRTGHGDDQVTVADWADATERTNRGVNRIEFADGTAWDSDDILLLTAALPIVGDDGYNVLLGDAGDNILEGGAGDDALKGGDGSDTYLLKLGAGKVTVVETGGEFDVIRFGSGIASGGISLERIGMDLILRNTVTGDEVAVKQWGQSDLNRAEAVQFADGTAWSASDISSKLGVAAGTGTSGDDLLAAWWGENGALHGLAGDDLLIGSSDDNVLDGGPGNDTVNGGLGSDVYLFDLGGGQDTVEETGGSLDAVRFGAGIASTDIVLTRSAYDLVLSIRGTDDRLTFLRWGEGETHRIERVEFADGSSWDASVMAHIMNVEQTGSASDDILWSWTDENATLRGLGGADRLYGGNGSDVLDGGPGDDFVLGGNGDDVFVFGRGYGKDMVSDKGGKGCRQAT